VLSHPTIDRLRDLGLIGMARALEEQRCRARQTGPQRSPAGTQGRVFAQITRRKERQTWRNHHKLTPFSPLAVHAAHPRLASLESPAGFDRNRWLVSIGIAGCLHRNPQFYRPLTIPQPW